MRKAIILAALMPLFAAADEFVLVKGGEIKPELAVATMADISSNAVQAVAVAQAAAVVEAAAEEVQELVDGVSAVVNGVEGIGYIRGYILDFGVSGVEANTNVTATIVRYDHSVSNDATYVYSDVYTYYSEEPGTLPVVRWSASPRLDAVWTDLTSIETELTTVTVGATTYDAYRSRVALPIAQEAAFYRVFAEAQQQQVGAYLPVRNGIKVGTHEPLTAEFVVGTNTVKFVGGIRVQ